MANNIQYTGLNADHISTNLANYESARSGFFSFIPGPGIKKFIRYTYTGDRREVFDENGEVIVSNAVLGDTAQEVLKLNVVASSIPDFTLEVLQYTRGNEIVKFAGKPSWGAGSLKIDDIVGLDTKAILMSWKGMAYDIHSRKGGRMTDYKLDCQLVEYTQDRVPIRIWDLEGCWIDSCEANDWDKENDSKKQITASLQYDRAIMSYDADSESVYNN